MITASSWAIGVSGGVAAGPNPAIWKFRELVRQRYGGDPQFICDAFGPAVDGQGIKTITLPDRHWAVMNSEGGSWLGNSKPGLPKNDDDFRRIYQALLAIGIKGLLWIGGDDSGKNLSRLSRLGTGLQTVLIPKTVDWDVNLPERAYTLGVQSCAHYGAQNVRALQVNSRMLDRTYATICMGRHSGRLPWLMYNEACNRPGIGNVEVLLTKEFFRYNTTAATIAAICVASRIKFETTHPNRLPFAHTIILGENLVDALQPGELMGGRVEHGHVVMAEMGLDKAIGSHIGSLLRRLKRPDYTKIEQMGVAPRGCPPIEADIRLAHNLTEYAFALLETGQSERVVYQTPSGRLGSSAFSELVNADGSGISLGLDDEMVLEVLPRLTLLNHDDLKSPNIDALAAQAGVPVDEFMHLFGPAVHAVFWRK